MAVPGLLFQWPQPEDSMVAARRPWSVCWLQDLLLLGSVVVAHGLGCSMACEIVLDKDSILALAGGCSCTVPAGKSPSLIFLI